MPNKFKASGKNYPCLACGDTGGKCTNILDATQETWLCMTYGIASKLERLPGYDGRIWIVSKQATVNPWATVHPDRTQEFSEDAKAKHKAEMEQRREQFLRMQAEALANEMPPDERHNQYTRVLSELGLSKNDREMLRARGFSDADIDEIGFRTVRKFQRVLSQYPANLPGYEINKFGRPQLQIYSDGIFCPIRDHKNRIVGAQVRATEPGKKRYRWISSQNSAYINGEMPVACWDVKAPAPNTRIWLAEGTGIKPKLASLRLNAPFIGASGGLFASSPQNTKTAIETLSTKYGSNVLTIAVDAGDIINPQVMNRIEYQLEWLQSEGYKIEIAWWGQITKEADDIDEIPQDRIGEIRYLTPDHFLLLAKNHGVIDSNGDSGGNSDGEGIEKDSRNDRRQDAISQEKRDKIGEYEPRPDYWNIWLRSREFTPDIVQTSEFVQFDAPEEGTILAVKSGLGSGKTYQLELLFGPGGAYEHDGAIALFSRNSLIYNFTGRVKRFTHLNDDLSILMKDPNSCLALCTNSLRKFLNPEWFNGKILIIDEFRGVAEHVACSVTHRNDRLTALELLKEVFRRAKAVILLDGMLTDWLIKWAGELAGNVKKIVKLENKGLRKKAKVEILLGTPTKSGKFDDANLSPYIAPMMGATEPFTIFSDSQKLLEQVEGILTAAGKKGLRIDSKTVYPESEARICLNNCNDWVEENRPDFVACSPTSQSGVDFNKPGYFKNSYGLFRGILATDDQMQMMGRNRDPECIWHISVPKQSFLADERFDIKNLNEAAARMMELAEMDIGELRLKKGWLGEQFLKYVEEASKDHNNRFAFKVSAKNSFERKNLRECLVFALEDSGHEIEQVSFFADGKAEAALKIEGEEVKTRTALQIFNAADITDAEAEKLATSWSATWEDRVKLIKRGYLNQLPGIDATEHWTADLIKYLKYENPKMISAANLLYQFLNPESSEKKQLNLWARIATEKGIYLPDLHSPFLKVKALESLNFERFLDPGKVWHKDSPELLELVRQGRKKFIANTLGFNVPIMAKGPNKGKPDTIRYLRRLFDLVGLRMGPCHKKREDGKLFNTYSLDDTWLNDPLWLAVQQAVENRFTEFTREWVKPDILTTPVRTQEESKPILRRASSIVCIYRDPEPQAVETRSPNETTSPSIAALETAFNPSNEPQTDRDGVDWRGLDLEIVEPTSGLQKGDRVTAISQPRVTDDRDESKWMLWVQNAVGRFLLHLKCLSLYFEPPEPA